MAYSKELKGCLFKVYVLFEPVEIFRAFSKPEKISEHARANDCWCLHMFSPTLEHVKLICCGITFEKRNITTKQFYVLKSW